MPFAGNVKLNHFLMLVGTSGLLAAAGAVYLFMQLEDGPVETAVLSAPDTAETVTEVRPGVTLKRDPAGESGAPDISDGSAGGETESAGPMRPVDEQMVVAWKAKPLTSAKKKDVSKGHPFKINVYQDEPGLGVNRAKVDLDRDDQWDHKYTFEPDGGVTRKVAPADDENYSVRQRWDGAAWVDES